jgi:predicted nucleic acid-binding protein
MIVSDTTTLIILSDLNRFDLLSNLFTHIYISPTVHQELNTKTKATLPSFISIKQCKDTETVDALAQLLDRGESEAIALAMELHSGLIIDEKKGRKIALSKGVKIIGLLGIITLNIQRKQISISQARAFLDTAIADGYRINTLLIETMFKHLEE